MPTKEYTWDLGEYQLRLNLVDEMMDEWRVGVYKKDPGWLVEYNTHGSRQCLIQGLGTIEMINGCDYRITYEILVNGEPHHIEAMPQNTVVHVKITALQKYKGWSKEVAFDNHHSWELRTKAGDLCVDYTEIHLWYKPDEIFYLSPRAGVGA